ncbi:MAG: LiaF-related protein [Bacteroidota bacterium]|nr:LiaF-related protein [Bacteroidota bacterium]
MNKNQNTYFLLIFIVPLILLTLGFVVKKSEKYRKEIRSTNEQELKVNIQAGFGKIRIERGTAAMILQADINAELKNDIDQYLDYFKRDETGYLNINTTETITRGSKKKKHSIHLGELQDNDWYMEFTDAIPISFDIELGMGKGNLDMTGLMVKDLNLSTGASSVVLRFDEPNKSSIENLTIESGLSKFKAYGLGNANFRHMKFEGGVGSYILDFSGVLEKEVNVDIQVGLGSMTISIPDDIGVKIFYEKSFMASIDFPKDIKEKEEDSYYSSNYYQANGRINMHIEAGLGSVKIKRE